jgi:hypothetical protein
VSGVHRTPGGRAAENGRTIGSTHPTEAERTAGVANGILDLDHLMCGVERTEVARRAFERLGFTLTPHSSIDSLGVGNVLVCMRPKGPGVANFVEFMATERPESVNATLNKLLSGGPGIKAIFNGLTDADAARREHAEAGFDMLDAWPVRREWRLPPGEVLQLAFQVLLPVPGQVPVEFGGVRYYTLEHYLREEFSAHPNGAVRWHTVSIVEAPERFEDTVRTYERLYGSSSMRDADGVTRIRVRHVTIRIVTSEALARLYPGVDLGAFSPPAAVGFTVEVHGLNRLIQILEQNDVPSQRVGDSIVVGPADACGNIVEFTEAWGTEEELHEY